MKNAVRTIVNIKPIVKNKKSLGCGECGRIHNVNDRTYFKVVGNLYIGSGGGLLGHREDLWNNLGVPENIFCLDGCFTKYLQKYEHVAKESNLDRG